MQQNLNWKKEYFSESYIIFNAEAQVGNLKINSFSQSAQAEINSEKFTIKTSGFFKPKTQIFDNQNNKKIAEITYNNWMNKATIIINGETFFFKYDNFWSSKWSISCLNKTHCKSNGSSITGQIQTDTDNNLLILLGIFIVNYYVQLISLITISSSIITVIISSSHI